MSESPDRHPLSPSVHEIALTLERMNGRLELLAYKVEVQARERGDYAPRPDHERLVGEVAEIRRDFEDVLPHVREMIRADDVRRARSEETLRAIVKWGAVALLAFIVACVLYALGLTPLPPLER